VRRTRNRLESRLFALTPGQQIPDSKSQMRSLCASGSVRALGEKSPGATRAESDGVPLPSAARELTSICGPNTISEIRSRLQGYNMMKQEHRFSLAAASLVLLLAAACGGTSSTSNGTTGGTMATGGTIGSGGMLGTGGMPAGGTVAAQVAQS
jgi:hypothetical protein